MPCGGIYPGADISVDRPCWFWTTGGREEDELLAGCGPSPAELFCEEWDTFLHVKCLIRFLQTEEGKGVMAHGHEIHVPIELWDKDK